MYKSEDEIARFRERVGLDRLILEGGDGIAADWDRLEASLAPVLGSLEPLPAGSPVLLSPGVTSRSWQWEGGDRHVTVAVYVTPTPAAAADKLVELVSVNMMATIPYEAGPEGLGDLAVRDTPEPAESLVWIYRNVCATVESLGADPAPGEIAARVQEFMAGYRVDDLAERTPRVSASLSANRAPVGGEVTVTVDVRHDGPVLGPEVVELRPYRLEPGDSRGSEFTFTAAEPGESTLAVLAADAVTLLSPETLLSLDVAPEE